MNKSQSKIISRAITELQDQQKAIEAIKDRKEALQEVAGKIADIRGSVESVCDELTDKLDGMSKKQLEGEKATKMTEHRDALETALSDMEGVETALQDETNEDPIADRTTEATDKLQEVIDKLGEV